MSTAKEMIKNYYQILGLSAGCSKDDIKKAYRIYATKFHPDKQNNDKFFEDRFKEVKEAYDILIDDNKRAQFDLNFNASSGSSYTRYGNSSDDLLNELIRKGKEKAQAEKAKRNEVFYTSKDLLLNGLYINCNGHSYDLSDYDMSTIRKDDNGNFVVIGIVMIVIGIFTITFFVGVFFLMFGIYALFYREYFVVIISRKGDVPLVKGRKFKMKKISRLINKAIELHR